MINLIPWVIFGLIIGALAKWIFPGKDPHGLVATTSVGIAGAIVGGLLSRIMGFRLSTFSLGGLILAVIGALIFLTAYKRITGRRI